MKLELKHIAPYLPYGLKCEILNYKSDYVGEKYGIINGYYSLNNETHYTFKDRGTAGKDKSLIKPILRPLSQLTEEIDLGGELFIPKDRLHEKYYQKYGAQGSSDMDYNNLIRILNHRKGYNHVPHWIYQDLIKWHFDVFSLIENKLAIDITTI